MFESCVIVASILNVIRLPKYYKLLPKVTKILNYRKSPKNREKLPKVIKITRSGDTEHVQEWSVFGSKKEVMSWDPGHSLYCAQDAVNYSASSNIRDETDDHATDLKSLESNSSNTCICQIQCFLWHIVFLITARDLYIVTDQWRSQPDDLALLCKF